MDTNRMEETFLKVVNWAGERNKVAKNYGIDTPLYIAEIHAIALIGEHSGITQKEISETMGITKGRVSILISNLIKKGLVIRDKESTGGKEKPLQLTSSGKIAFDDHQKKEMIRIQKIREVLKQCSQEEMDKYSAVMEEVLTILKE